MTDEWDDNADLPQSTNTSSFADEGRTYGKGRGYVPLNNNNGDKGVGSKNGHYKSGNDSSGFGTDNNNDNSGGGWGSGGGGGGWGSGGGGGGWGSSGGGGDDGNDREGGGDRRGRGRGGGRGGYRDRNDNRDGDDNSRPRGRGGRGGGRGGRGGFKDRDEDGDGESGGFGGRGFGKKFGDDDDSRPSRGRGGRGGGRGRSDRDDDDEGGGGKNGWGDGGEDKNGEDPDKPPPVTYIPPEISNDDSDIFDSVNVGLNFAKYDDIKVSVTGENPPSPIEDYKAMGLRTLVLDNIVKSGYTKPTPVQKYAIPIIIASRDLMACAQTGSGKTAAFMVPIINTLLERPSELKLIPGGCEPHCVVVSPTRELAEQIWRQALKFSKDSVIKCCVIYGGVATMHQGNQVANGCHILVATPGRLLDFVGRGRVSFASIRYVVLDEADRMLDMGFLENMRTMMDHETMVPKVERQTLMFSATFGEQVQHIARDFLNDYLFLTVGIVGGACSDVEQSFHEVPKFEKRSKLKELLEREDANSLPRTLVFVEMKKTADFIAAFLSQNNFPTTSMHGDRMQQQREEALRDFRCGKMPVLVATAVAARGLDIKNVAHVINYDMPKDIDEYVHRIGRTGRVGNRGKATSFFDPGTDSGIVDGLVKILSQAGQTVPDWLSGGGGGFAPGRDDKFGGRDVRNFGNDGMYEQSSNLPNTACNPEPEEEW